MRVKECPRCKTVKFENEFGKRKDRKDGLRNWCNSCENTESKKYRKKNSDKCKDHHLKNTFGISLEDYNKMLEAQHGRCAGCGDSPDDRALDVDHNHITGKNRGLLCRRCNFVLGYSRDNPFILQRLIEYLAKA
jgi:hypothetical protein